MKNFDYTVETAKSFDEAVRSIEDASVQAGFRVLATHDITGALREKGFEREPLKIVEICNARYANEVLQKDPKLALLLPCPISVHTEGGKTFISTMKPTAMTSFYPEAGIESVAAEVEKLVVEILNRAAA